MKKLRGKGKKAAPAKPRDGAAKPASAGREGRPLLFFFLPVALAAAVMMIVLVLVAQQQGQAIQTEAAQAQARAAAQALAGQVSGEVRAYQEVLEVITRFAAVQKALGEKDPQGLARSAAALQRLRPDVIELRLFPQERVQTDSSGRLPLSFAGVDMVTRALQGEQVPVEVHQPEGAPSYLAVAQPVLRDAEVIGAVLGAWPLQDLDQLAGSFAGERVELSLMQGGASGIRIASSGSAEPGLDSARVAVNGTRWEVFYRPLMDSFPGLGVFLWVLVIAGTVVVLLVVFLQQRALAAGLASDLGTLLTLGEAIAGGEKTGLASRATISISREPIHRMAGLLRRGPAHRSVKPVAVAQAADGRDPDTSEGVRVAPAAAQLADDGASARPPVTAPESVFRAYDIRGMADTELTAEMAEGLGWAFAGMAATQDISSVYVAHDARLSSPELYEAICAGLADSGMRVLELGMAPAALIYFAMHRDPEAGAVLVTGSHNPPEYNGFKLYLRTEPVQGEGLRDLCQRMQQGGSLPLPGSREAQDPRQDYLAAVIQEISLTRPLRVVVDGGNGAAGELACEVLTILGCEAVPLFCEPDGSFPNHHPDPSVAENLEALRHEVVSRGADLGIALDGDGDRIALVDDQGEMVSPEHALMFLAGDILRRHPGSDVIYDVKSSRQLAGFVLAHGGRPIMWRSGHSRMKEKMRETGALLGGEYAGHVYIKERWYGSDDAIYVGARLLEVLADDPRPLHDQVAELPSSPSTPEYRLPLEEGESGLLMDAITANLHFPDARIIDLDGLRVEFPNAWGLVRASNTVPSLTFRFEADSEQELERIMQRFREVLAQVVPERSLPF